MYVDDVMVGGDILEDVLKIKNQTEQLFLSGGFPLNKWADSHDAL